MDIFSEVLDRTNEWLKFAEAKNGLLVAGSTSIAIAGLRLLLSPTTSGPLTAYLYLLLLFSAIGATLGLVSFLPAVRFPSILMGNSVSKSDNLLFFGHLATLRPLMLAESLRNSQDPCLTEMPIHLSYAEQIIVNSRIALIKYTLFTWGLRALIIALLTPIIGGIILVLADSKDGSIND